MKGNPQLPIPRGRVVGWLACPVLEPHWQTPIPCAHVALLYRHPDPWGYRTLCEGGHVLMYPEHQVPVHHPAYGSRT